MNEKNCGKRVRALQKRLVVAGIIEALVLALVAVIAIPHFLTQPRRPRLEAYYIDPS